MSKWILFKILILFLIIATPILAIVIFFAVKTDVVLNKISVSEQNVGKEFYLPKNDTQKDKQNENLLNLNDYVEPPKDPDRINVLLLGIRGADDPYGGLLTDTILLISYKISTSELALISIPRDIYIKLPFQNQWKKINEAYVEGLKFGGERGGLELARHTIQRITGVAIDHIIRVDFEVFKKAVDLVGGIDIYLDKPFEEKEQFKGAGTFYLPQGKNHLTSQQALYFVRSRYSTDDFDRARRTQQVLIALKDKFLENKDLFNFAKINEILNILGDHIRTDMSVTQIKDYFFRYRNVNLSKIKTKVFTTGSNGQLVAKMLNGVYILLPKDGNFEKIQNEVKNIFNLK